MLKTKTALASIAGNRMNWIAIAKLGWLKKYAFTISNKELYRISEKQVLKIYKKYIRYRAEKAFFKKNT